jgi:hypothetical protein
MADIYASCWFYDRWRQRENAYEAALALHGILQAAGISAEVVGGEPDGGKDWDGSYPEGVAFYLRVADADAARAEEIVKPHRRPGVY